MRKGFIFDHKKCVGCNACSAACIIENGWSVQPRHIFIYNPEADQNLQVINLSLACNHCESAVCMEGCPASAFIRDIDTGAIVLDDSKCIGCKYCQWNCPYDAPKLDDKMKTIAKCHLCNSGLSEGRQPACSSACPTGALKYGELGADAQNTIPWFPDKNLKPAFEFAGDINGSHLKIIPEKHFSRQVYETDKNPKNLTGELSLIAFSFLSTISVSTIISSFIKGIFPSKLIFIPVLLLAGAVTFLHLGKKMRSWRSVTNIKKSPLSREIIAFIAYSIISLTTVFSHLPVLLLASSVMGLVFLLAIDGVYIYSDKNRSVFLHSGQTFISALIIVSYISGLMLPFIFVALLKLISSLSGLLNKKHNQSDQGIRFLRLAFLIVPGAGMIFHISTNDLLIVSVFLAGELLDRILFYIDFNPLNINTLIKEQLNIEKDEKKRGE
jgi:Fe-S-cluster-containing dehydrogenase component/DMSO reductase anchor subunit